ncbi:MAG: hypothetical protein M0R80_19020 [Proteobacteria bacterium]|jgi:hypothetical protein|nr:hypothetical protein [Pseudomonadota bacterium]
MSALSSLLVQDRILSVTQVEQVLQRQVIYGGDLATNLLELGMIREDALVEYIARVVRMPVLDPVWLENVPEEVLALIPRQIVADRRIMPVALEGDSLTIAASGPITVAALDDIAFLLKSEIVPHLVLEFRLGMALQRYYRVPMSSRTAALQRKLVPGFSADVPPDATPTVSAPPAAPAPAEPEPEPAPEPEPEPAPPAAKEVRQSTQRIVIESIKERPRSLDTTMKIVTGAAREPAVQLVRENTLEVPLAPPPAPPPPPAAEPRKLISFSEASELLREAEDRDAILSLLMAFSSQAFEFTALFVVQDNAAQGRMATVRGKAPHSLETVAVPLGEPGVFESVQRTRGYHLGPIGEAAADRRALSDMGREVPRGCALIPVVVRDRVVLMLYGDSGATGVRANRIARIAEFGHLVAAAFERLLLKRKFGQYGRPSMVPTRPKAGAQAVPEGRAIVAPAAAKKKDLGAFAGRASAAELGPSVEAAFAQVTAAPAPASDLPLRPIQSGPAVRILAPAIMSAPVTQPAPPAPPSEPSVDPELVRKVEVITVRNSAPPPVATGRTVFRSAVVPAAPVAQEPATEGPPAPPPPRARISEPPAGGPGVYMEIVGERSAPVSHRPAVSSTVRVEMREEIEHLVSRVQERGRFDEASARLLVGMGDDAIVEMIRRFPGPLDCDRYQESSRLKRVGQHGPLLRALLMFGVQAAPYVAPMMDSFDSEIRFYATFFFSEVPAPDALPGLVKRLFDGDRQIRVVALDVIKSFEAYPEYVWTVQEIAAILRSSSSSLEKKRLAADALGELRHPVAIRPLAEMLGSVDGILAERCQRALVKITFTDFGFSERRWIAWFVANAGVHRIEWALASINHRVEEIRLSAVEELRRMVGGAIEWPRGPMDHRLRKEIRRRVLSWWEREGKALNPIAAVE